MRSLWLASAALIVSTGIACAQTSTAAPAATNSTNGPVQTNPGLSPGQTTPPPSTSGQSMTSPGAASMAPAGPGNSTAANAPAPDGAANAPIESSPGSSPGKTGPNTQDQAIAPPAQPATHQSASAATPEGEGKHHMRHPHHMGGPLPAEASAAAYLHVARDALRHNDKARADDALSHAETRILTRAVPQSASIPTDDSPAISSIEHARQALAAGNLSEASSDTEAAMHEIHHGPMANMGMGASKPAE